MDLLQFLREPLAQHAALPAFLPAQIGEMGMLALASGLLGLVLFVPLCVSIWKRTAEQNLATFLLWGLLDGLAAASSFAAGGNYLLPAFYTLGSIAVLTCIILRSRTIKWTWLETFCSVMAVLCVITWMNWDRQQLFAVPLSAEQMVVVLSSTALVIAGLPLLWDAVVKPETSAPLTYLGYTAANALSAVSGASWAVEERFYGSSAALLTLFVVLAGARKWFGERSSVLAH